jgi:hypothetical protein
MKHITRLSNCLFRPLTSNLKHRTSNVRPYTNPIVASVGSSIADVTANPLSAW